MLDFRDEGMAIKRRLEIPGAICVLFCFFCFVVLFVIVLCVSQYVEKIRKMCRPQILIEGT